MARLIVVRHGECQANLEHRLAGSKNDSPLTEKGIDQARETGQALLDSRIKPDRIISSPLSRALDTARVIAKELNFDGEIQIDDRIIERDFGGATDRPITDSLFSETTDMETPSHLHDRLRDFFQSLDNSSDENMLIVTHAGVSHMIDVIFHDTFSVDEFFRAPKLGNAEFWILDTADVKSQKGEYEQR